MTIHSPSEPERALQIAPTSSASGTPGRGLAALRDSAFAPPSRAWIDGTWADAASGETFEDRSRSTAP